MAQSLACVVSSGALKLEGLAAQGAANARVLNGKPSTSSVAAVRRNVVVSASLNNEEAQTSSRRSVLSLLAASVAAGTLAQNASALVDIPIGPAPLPSGGLPGTENADEARDFDKNLIDRFYFQVVEGKEVQLRIKAAVDEIIAVKSLIDKKAWPYVMNDLRSKASYLRFDLKKVIDGKPKEVKKELVSLKNKVFDSLDKLDYAARCKSTPKAEAAYAEAVGLLKDLVSSLA
ncbi:unnamed protein product [Calypogeia fissa]